MGVKGNKTKLVYCIFVFTLLFVAEINQNFEVNAALIYGFDTERSSATQSSIATQLPSPLFSPLELSATQTLSKVAQTIPQSDHLSIYSDQAETVPCASIEWGILSPGSTTNMELYAKNKGNTPVTLSKKTENFNPPTLLNYLALTWDYTNQSIAPGATLKITLTLKISPNISGISAFHFDTVITSTG